MARVPKPRVLRARTAGVSASMPHTVRGSGPDLVFLGGFAMTPAAYDRAIDILADHVRVIAPSVFRRGRRWDYDAVLDELDALLDGLDVQRAVVVGHSFGGGVALGLAARRPALVERLVFVDSQGLAPSWQMAADAFTCPHLLRMATVGSVRDFVGSVVHRPTALPRAGYWAFRVDKRDEIAAVRASGIPTNVLFAPDDSLLPWERGAAWAAELDGSFEVVPATGPLDHEWPMTRPALFAATLLRVLAEGGTGRSSDRAPADAPDRPHERPG